MRQQDLSPAEKQALKELETEAQNALFHRQRMYQQVFTRDEKGNFSPVAQELLEDLAEFCHAHTSTFDRDPRTQAFNEGKRDVWLRFERHLQMSSQKLWELYKRRDF